VVAFDVLRAVAAAAVVIIHVLGPYRERLGEMPDSQWAIVVALNGLCRWSVPVFIMITGALLLADSRPFELGYFLRRRVSKVLIPFVAWSIGYAVLAGLSIAGYDPAVTAERLAALPAHETYYHLGFFYYFIPLYLLIPLLRPLASRTAPCRWLQSPVHGSCLTVLYLVNADGIFGVDPVMWRLPAPRPCCSCIAAYPCCCSGRWPRGRGGHRPFGDRYQLRGAAIQNRTLVFYKTVNTMVLAGFVFAAILLHAPRLPARASRAFRFVGATVSSISFIPVSVAGARIRPLPRTPPAHHPALDNRLRWTCTGSEAGS
jgi:hypothetical protein